VRSPLARLAPPLLAAVLGASAASAQSYLPRAQAIGGNPGPAHNYVCPNVEGKASALDCYLDAVAHLYRMCKHVKSIEIIEHGYEHSEAGTNSAKSESCVQKQTQNIARPYQAALREATISRQAHEAVRSLHEFWTASLGALKWRHGESDDDYKQRTAAVFGDFDAKAEGIRTIIAVVREHTATTKAAARPKAAR
jgi:hypothetical protein